MAGLGTGDWDLPYEVGPVLNLKLGEWRNKGRMASRKRLEICRGIVDSVGQFDLALLGLGPRLMKAHSVGFESGSQQNFGKGFFLVGPN